MTIQSLALAIPADSPAQLFLKYNYVETKDLAKHFLTFVSSILVFSLTFSEKIAGFPKAPLATRRLLVGAWCFMLISILGCGWSRTRSLVDVRCTAATTATWRH